VKTSKSAGGPLSEALSRPVTNVSLPALTGWKSMNQLPEREIDCDDSGAAWKIANDTTTPNPTKPFSLPVLYLDQYQFYVRTSLFRTNISGSPTTLTLGLQGGTAFGLSVLLNSRQIGSYFENALLKARNMTFTIQPSVLRPETEGNVLLIIMDNIGHD
jgi:beta-galactosidase